MDVLQRLGMMNQHIGSLTLARKDKHGSNSPSGPWLGLKHRKRAKREGFRSNTTHETYWVRFQPPGEFPPSEWPRRTRLYLKWIISPIIELLILPVWHSSWPVTRMNLSGSYIFQFSLNILTRKLATETCLIHTKLQLSYKQHATETRSSHHPGMTLKLTSEKNWFVWIIYISTFSEYFDQKVDHWNVPYSHQTSTVI